MASSKTKGKAAAPSKRYAIVSFIHPKNAGAKTISNYRNAKGETVNLKDSAGNDCERTIRPPHVRLDLDVTDDRLFYELLQKHIFVVGSNPVLKITNVNEDAKNANQSIEATMKVNALIVAMGEEELLDLGLLLGFTVEQGDNEVVKNKIYNYVAKNPADIVRKLEDPDYKLRVVVHKAKSEEDFKEENGVWKYGQTIVGKDIDQVVMWLKENPIVLNALKNRFEEVAA